MKDYQSIQNPLHEKISHSNSEVIDTENFKGIKLENNFLAFEEESCIFSSPWTFTETHLGNFGPKLRLKGGSYGW